MNTDHLTSQTDAQEILWLDLGTTREALQRDLASQYLRRQLVRGFCAYTEAHTFYLKSTVLFVRQLVFGLLSADPTPVRARLGEFFSLEFHSAEIQLLREQNSEVDDSGGIRTTPKFIHAARNIRFAQASYLRSIKTGFAVNYQDHGWATLREVITLRNRLTHPKTKDDLAVSDAALNHVIAANDWFRDTSFNMTKAGNERLEAFVALLP